MSHSYGTRSFTVPLDTLPATFNTLEEFDAFSKDVGGKAHDKPEGFHHLFGDTRSGWAIDTTANLLASLPDTSALQFLTFEATTRKFEDEHGFTAVSILDAPAVERAARQLAQVLVTVQDQPMLLYDADKGGVLYDVESVLARDYVSKTPAYDQQVRGDEGQSADYLLTYLRSVLALLRTAQKERLGVVHGLTV